jgi:hypothetical protein
MLASYGILVVEGLCYKLSYKVFKLEVSNYLGNLFIFWGDFLQLGNHKKRASKFHAFFPRTCYKSLYTLKIKKMYAWNSIILIFGGYLSMKEGILFVLFCIDEIH